MPRKITIGDLARDLNLAKSTVSRALRGNPVIAKNTRERVAKRAHQLGYRRDLLLSRFAVGRFAADERLRHPAIAWIHCTGGNKDRNPAHFLSERIEGAREQARKQGYRLESHVLPVHTDPGNLAQTLEAQGIRGMILDPEGEDTLLPDWNWDLYSAVSCEDVSTRSFAFHTVKNSLLDSIDVAWQKALEYGYKRIGVCLPFSRIQARDRFASIGIVVYQQIRCQHLYEPIPIIDSDSPRIFTKWVKRYRPDVILSLDESHLALLRKGGYKIPQNIGFILLNRNTSCPEVSCVDPRDRILGQTLLDLCVQLLLDHETGIPIDPRTIRIAPVWHDGSTLPQKGECHPDLLTGQVPRPPAELHLRGI